MSQNNVDARIIGVIGKPHGIKGELNVMMVTDYPNTILKGSLLYLDIECTIPLEIGNIRQKKLKGRDISIIKFLGINDRNEAEKLRGKDLYRHGSEIPELEKDKFWIDDLIGCDVVMDDDTLIGVVKEVESLASNQNLAVAVENNDRKISGLTGNMLYIPLIVDYIKNIDISSRKIILKKMPEYI